jgi:hypothetical protein
MHRVWRSARQLAFAAVSAVLMAQLGSATGVAAQAVEPADPVAVLERFYEARNAENQAAALALVADDLYVPGTGLCPPERVCRGPAPLELDIANGIATHTRFTLVDPRVSGTTVTATLEARNANFRAAGVDRGISTLTVDIHNGKLATFQEVRDASDPQIAAFEAFQRARASAAAQLPRVLPRAGDAPPGPASLATGGLLLLVVGLGLKRSPWPISPPRGGRAARGAHLCQGISPVLAVSAVEVP